MIFLAAGAIITNGTSARQPVHVNSTYGLGLVIALVGGFGLLARIGVQHGQMPVWAMFKIGIWGVFLALLFLLQRRPSWTRYVWHLAILLGATAAYIAVNKASFF